MENTYTEILNREEERIIRPYDLDLGVKTPVIPKPVENVCNLKGYTPISELGQGNFSHVWKVEEKFGANAGRIGALKVLKKLKLKNQGGLFIEQEARVQKDLFYATYEKYGLALVPEVYDFEQHWEHNGYILMQAYSTNDCLASYEIPYGTEWLNTVLNVAKVHEVMHRSGKHNGDLKRRNTLTNGVVIDFGSCEKKYEYHAGKRSRAVVCTLGYASPEQLSLVDSKDSRQTDVFSLAVMAYMLASGNAPFEHSDLGSYKWNLFFNSANPLDTLEIGVANAASELVQHMMNFKPNSRPRMEDVVNTLESIVEEEKIKIFNKTKKISARLSLN